jgi:beta-glucosidase
MGFEQGGSRAVMASYNAWNGTTMMVNPVLKNVMIKEWGNDGIICTDGGALGLLITAHKLSRTRSMARRRRSRRGSITFSIRLQRRPDQGAERRPGDRGGYRRGGERICCACICGWARWIRGSGSLWGDRQENRCWDQCHAGDALTPPWERESSKALARLATDESIVLLKNEGNTLPLDRKKLKTIAVIGPWADQVLLDWYSGTPPYFVSALEGFAKAPDLG